MVGMKKKKQGKYPKKRFRYGGKAIPILGWYHYELFQRTKIGQMIFLGPFL